MSFFILPDNIQSNYPVKKILVILLAAIGVGIGLILFGVLGILAVLAILSTGCFIFAFVELEKSWPVRYSKGERASDIAPAILASWLFGLLSFFLWLLFFVVLYFTW